MPNGITIDGAFVSEATIRVLLASQPAAPAPAPAPVFKTTSGAVITLSHVAQGVQVNANGARVLLLRNDGWLIRFTGINRAIAKLKTRTSDGSNRLAVRDARKVDVNGAEKR